MTSQLMLARSSETVSDFWHRAVTEGERQAEISLSPLLKGHLAMTLRSYIRDLALCRVVAREYMQPRDAEDLVKVAGRCLLIEGLFPELFRRRNVHKGYFVEIGTSAYHAHAVYWSARGRHGYAECSRSAAEHFLDLVGTLMGMNNSPNIAEALQALRTPHNKWN